MRNNVIKKMASLAMLAAMVVVLQTVASGIKIGTFSITLSLIPIIVGAILYGIQGGLFLGGVFGLVVTIATVTGADAGAYLLFQATPVWTVIVCMGKGIAAGVASAMTYKLLVGVNGTVRILAASFICPIVNTGLFCIACITVFISVVSGWGIAGGFETTINYIIFGLTGTNFLVEMSINALLAPAIVQIVRIGKK